MYLEQLHSTHIPVPCSHVHILPGTLCPFLVQLLLFLHHSHIHRLFLNQALCLLMSQELWIALFQGKELAVGRKTKEEKKDKS